MKKKILIISTLILFATGCNCEYNLNIENNVYKEEVILMGEDASEVYSFNKKWEIPVDKDEYNVGLDPQSDSIDSSDIYTYKLSGNNLTFSHNFTKNEYAKSSAVSNCYDMLTVSNYSDSIIISSSQNVKCFDRYPSLNNVTVNIKVDKKVTSNNADNLNGNTYTWQLNKNNVNNKSINLVLENKSTESDDSSNSSSNNVITKKEQDYTLYIFSGILLVIMLIGYFIFNKIKNKNDQMDD